MTRKDERIMFLHALQKWRFILDAEIAGNTKSDILSKFPHLANYIYSCPFCTVYKKINCDGCPLYEKEGADCSDSDSNYWKWSYINIISSGLVYAQNIFNNIKEMAEKRGYVTFTDKELRDPGHAVE